MWDAITAIATVATAIVAVVTLLALRADSKDRTRPFVVVDLERAPNSRGQGRLDLVLRNYGVTPARDLKVTFTPHPITIAGDGRPAVVAKVLEHRFRPVFHVLPAGRPIRAAYYIGVPDPKNPGSTRNDEPLPDSFTVHVEYQGARTKKPYRDTFRLSVEDYWHETDGTTRSHPSSPDKDLVHAVENVVRQLNRR